MPGADIVVVGTGIAGAQVGIACRQRGYAGSILLIGEETHAPYHRPPLSKAFLKSGATATDTLLRPEQFWSEKNIELLKGTRAVKIDREGHALVLADGRRLEYGHLVLATGARNLPLPGTDRTLSGVVQLRTVDDAAKLRAVLADATRLVVIGGGFIGMEVAATARSRGVEVVVVEALPRLMARAASPVLSQFIKDTHLRNGVRVITGERVSGLHGNEQVTGVELAEGEVLPADAVLVGVGVVPETTLAADAELNTDDGIIVNEQLLTNDHAISAVGDCARFPCLVTGSVVRLESVQNATDQARTVAAGVTGDRHPHVATPWFWTEQYDHRIQIAGVATESDLTDVVRGDPQQGGFSIGRFRGDHLVSIESVDQAADHMAARKLLGAGVNVTPHQVADASIPLKALLDE
jgi:3-phenylpropionate/trans-cinnamate dioxygenase ferredoxin reductase subunit